MKKENKWKNKKLVKIKIINKKKIEEPIIKLRVMKMNHKEGGTYIKYIYRVLLEAMHEGIF